MGDTRVNSLSIKGYLKNLFQGRENKRTSPKTLERQRFEEDAKDQFIELKKKGLGIPVFTL